jgi:tetratricopeptide (TPR) repeat protein
LKFKPPHYEFVLDMALEMTNTESNQSYWASYNQLREVCEKHEGTLLNHAFQWETLADFTSDKSEAINLYLKALDLANNSEQLEYIASISLSLAELYLDLGQNDAVKIYIETANEASKQTSDLSLRTEISEFLLSFNQNIT